MKMYEKLKTNLPAGWKAWHSLRLRVGGEWEGEGDFVIAHPPRGFIVVEVKGGQIELRDGRWFQNGREMEKSPRQQAFAFAHHLADELRKKVNINPPFGVACVFPDTDFSVGPSCGDLAGAVMSERDLNWLEVSLPKIFSAVVPQQPSSQPNNRWIKALHDLWGETWVPHVSLSDRVADAEKANIALDREQLRILDFAGENTRAIVSGGAGSGKTIVAREVCLKWARSGLSTLYLCFTNPLAAEVNHYFQSKNIDGARLRAVSIGEYIVELLDAAGLKPNQDDPAFWKMAPIQTACDAMPRDKPGAVVLDEAQDLDRETWTFMQSLTEGIPFWVFYDEHQKFWKERLAEPPLDTTVKLKLPGQHRNPPAIERFASLYNESMTAAGAHAHTPAGTVFDCETIRLITADQDNLFARLQHEIGELRRKGARAEDIAIISLSGQLRSQLVSLHQLGSHRLHAADDENAPHGIVADTFLRFKGLERPFIVIVELEAGAVSRYDVRMHIALTRATVAVTIICTEEAVTRDPRLAALRPSG